jgi:hypothetical protein
VNAHGLPVWFTGRGWQVQEQRVAGEADLDREVEEQR